MARRSSLSPAGGYRYLTLRQISVKAPHLHI